MISVSKGLSVSKDSIFLLNIRYSQVNPEAGSPLKNQREVLVGVNKYINKHRIKLQGHVGIKAVMMTRAPEIGFWV